MRADRPGTILAGKYELIRVAGQGGMAQVWRARIRGETGSRFVAVKRMLVDADRADQFSELFREEARVGLQLRHPNIVGVIDFVASKEDGYFLVMDWVEGLDLLDFMRAFHTDQRHVPWQAIAAIGRGVSKGLAGAHERKGADGTRQPVIHRDVTPGNILLGIDGAVKITDFGLARAMDRGNMTMPNTIKGKLSYTAPEVAEGQRATERSDLFGLGVTLWEALAGTKLFTGKSNFDVIEAIFRWDVRKLAPLRPDVPAALVQVVERAIARHPADRFASARLMAAALDNVLRSDPVSASRLGSSVVAARDRLAELDGSSRDPSMLDEDEVAQRAPIAVHIRPVPPPPPPPARATPRPRPAKPRGRYDSAPEIRVESAPEVRVEPASGDSLSDIRVESASDIRQPRPPHETIELSFSDLFSSDGKGSAPQKPPPAESAVAARKPAPHVSVLSKSDLFSSEIKGVADPKSSPAAARIGVPRTRSEAVLDHPSSWNLDLAELDLDKGDKR